MTKVEKIITSIRDTLKDFTKPESKVFIDTVNQIIVHTIPDKVHTNIMHIFITLYDGTKIYYNEHFYYHPNIDITMAPIMFTINKYYRG